MGMTVSLSVDVRKYCDHVNGCIESVKGQNLKKKLIHKCRILYDAYVGSAFFFNQADVFLMLFSPMLYNFVI